MHASARRIVRPLFLLFFLSGFSGLIYEAIWSHYLKLVLGHAAYAQTLVLSIYMGGLALGSFLSSRVRIANPVLWYGAIEAAIGIAAMGFHEVFELVTGTLFGSWLPALPAGATIALVKWSVCALLILPQSVLLGATFPLMSAGILRVMPGEAGRVLATLYFTNSIGAAVGVLSSAFVLVPLAGLPGTLLLAGVFNVLIGVLAALWARRMGRAAPVSDAPRVEGAIAAPAAAERSLLGPGLLVASALTGLASFLYEVGWIRMLSLVLGSTSQAFELMLAAFITGLALGGLWVRRRIDSSREPLRLLGSVQVAMGMCAALTVLVYDRCFDVMGVLMRVLPRTDQGYLLFHLSSQALAMVVMLPATVFAGMTLPLITYVLLRTGQGERAVGRVYAANTLGSIAGVLLAVHVALPVLGLQGTLGLGAALDVGLGLVLLGVTGGLTRAPARWLVASALVVLVVSQAGLAFDERRMASGVYRHGASRVGDDTELLSHRDGKTATISVLRAPDGTITISTNGKPDAAINPERADGTIDEHTMIVAAALPLAMRSGTLDVANIGFGSGVTTHTLLGSRRVRRVDTIEIEPFMVEGARHFGPLARRALHDPRSLIHIDDAKAFFATKKHRYDVIVSEPSNPWVSGVATLFTEEFYRAMQSYLTEGGLLVQWVQCYETNFDIVSSVFKALTKSFPSYEVYSANGTDLIVVATRRGSLEPHAKLFHEPGMRELLGRIGMRDLAELGARRIGGRKVLEPFLLGTGAPSNSDYFPFVAEEAPRARFLGQQALQLSSLAFAPVPVVDLLEQRVTAPGAELPRLRYFAWSIAQRSAWALSRFSVTGLDADAPKERGPRQVAKELGLCANEDVTPMQGRLALHALAAITTPFLPPERARPIWQSELVLRCDARAGPGSWRPLYEALASRDLPATAATARAALKSAAGLRIEIARYALAAGLAAELALGRAEAARELASSHRQLLVPPMPPYLALLSAHLPIP